ncbi:MAG: hypothetical protein QJQ54_02230 [Mollicutes bacterium]|nr:MAG: hypothetical protein QJQ54_02230 [Mollicutes bacterium]
MLHHFSFKKNLKYFIEKISQKFQYGEKDVENYLFQLLDLNPQPDQVLHTYLDIHNQQLTNLTKEMKNLMEKYFKHINDEMFFLLKEKLNLDVENIDFYLVGEITNISNIEAYLKSKPQFSR